MKITFVLLLLTLSNPETGELSQHTYAIKDGIKECQTILTNIRLVDKKRREKLAEEEFPIYDKPFLEIGQCLYWDIHVAPYRSSKNKIINALPGVSNYD